VTGPHIEVLVFHAAGERYAFETTHIAQVCPMLPVTAIPGVPDYVVGIAGVQGEVLSVVDLRSLLDLPLVRLAEPNAIIVLKGEALEFGILAEDIVGIERYPEAALERMPATLADKQKTYLKGVSADRTAILDARQLLSDPRLAVDAG
jgi:purine-binding chemotaxis protein CheW